MGVYGDIDKKTALGIINSLANIEGAENGITVSQEFLKSLFNALNENEQVKEGVNEDNDTKATWPSTKY